MRVLRSGTINVSVRRFQACRLNVSCPPVSPGDRGRLHDSNDSNEGEDVQCQESTVSSYHQTCNVDRSLSGDGASIRHLLIWIYTQNISESTIKMRTASKRYQRRQCILRIS